MKQFNKYSQFYDSIYENKDYKSEADFIDNTIKTFSEEKVESILSLGCGTCSHDILLAKSGYSITGVDMSSSMLEIANKKISKEGLNEKIKLIQSDIRKLKLNKKHDSAIAMFNVIGYQIKNKDINSTFKSVSKGLKKGGLLMFDCWYMPAVLNDRPTDKIKKISISDNKSITRLTSSHLNINKNTIDINFEVLEVEENKITNNIKETHRMRYWSSPEIKNILNNNGFSLLKTCKYMEIGSIPDEKEWNIFVVAKKR